MAMGFDPHELTNHATLQNPSHLLPQLWMASFQWVQLSSGGRGMKQISLQPETIDVCVYVCVCVCVCVREVCVYGL